MLNVVPVVGQTLGNSRDLIAANFATINTAFNVNHVQYGDGSGNQGKHNFVSFPRVTAPVAPATLATGVNEVAIYAAPGSNAATTELYFQRPSQGPGTGYSFTDMLNVSTGGWTRLPSGLMIKWGQGTAFANAAAVTKLFAGPAFANPVYSVQVTANGVSGGFTEYCAQTGALTTTGFNVFIRAIGTPGGNNIPYTYIAIGF